MLKLIKLLFTSSTLITLPLISVNAVAVELVGRAILSADTFTPGATSGQLITDNTNGVQVPFVNQQPVQGFSAVLPGPKPGTYLVTVDNGFGQKANSPDFLLRVYAVEPNFSTGEVFPVNFKTGERLNSFTNESFLQLSDSGNKAGISIVADQSLYPGSFTQRNPHGIPVDNAIKSGRLLTGGDFDIESFRQVSDGTYWFGDEFGPYLLHVAANGQLIEAPLFLPNVLQLGDSPLVQSPDHPAFAGLFPDEQRLAAANLPRSRGFEGMALNASGTKLYAMLEGPLKSDPMRDRVIIYEYDLVNKKYTGKTFFYRLEKPFEEGYAIGDLTAINDREFMLIERDGKQGDPRNPAFKEPAGFKRIYKINFKKVDKEGFVQKELLVDLLNIPDPQGVGGNGTINSVFTFPFFTIESVVLVDNMTLLVINDNNYPLSVARTPGKPDDNEFILIRLVDTLSTKETKILDSTKSLAHTGLLQQE